MTKYDMDPDRVTEGIERLHAAGDEFATSWQRRRQALTDRLAGVGNDVVSQAFLAKYQPVAERLMTRADAIPRTYRDCCDELRCCVDDYRAADATGVSALHEVDPRTRSSE